LDGPFLSRPKVYKTKSKVRKMLKRDLHKLGSYNITLLQDIVKENICTALTTQLKVHFVHGNTSIKIQGAVVIYLYHTRTSKYIFRQLWYSWTNTKLL